MIFNLFKSKPALKELIQGGFVDIHSHILPGIDDGSHSVSESVRLIRKMHEMGFTKIIGTPHTYPGVYDNSNESIRNSFQSLSDSKINLPISYASEYIIDEYLIQKAEKKSLLTLKKNYVLVEMSFVSAPLNLYDIIFKLRTNGYIPVLAHPERYRFIINDFSQYFKLKNHGCKFQTNLLSLIGYYGNDILNVTEKLLENNLIDFLGSDIHNMNHIKLFSKKIKVKKISKLIQVIERNKLFH